MNPGPLSADHRLDSWKAIATYLGREVRTVQGWEKTEALPVHRHQHARQGSVYAFKPELDAWRDARRGIPEAVAAPVETGKNRRLFAVAAALCLLVLAITGALNWGGGAARVTSTPSSVVVLPFLDLSEQKDQEYFSDGLTEELIDALTRIPNLRVVARTSSFAFKGKGMDIREIGRQLNVNAVLEGSVRKSGDRLRITAQLARVSDGYHYWSHIYDRQLKDVFAVQREISQSIADLLRAGQIPQREEPRDLEAYRLYQEGRYFFNKFEYPESNRKAIERYQQAIQRDPRLAIAYAGLADAWAYLEENFAVAPKEAVPHAREAALKALELDETLADAHISLGILKLDYDRDREGGQREFLRAMQLNPGSGYARHWYAHSLEAQGRLPEAMKEMRAALDLDPLSIPIHWDIGGELLSAGRIDDALDWVKKSRELFPNLPVFAFLEVYALTAKGDGAAARRIVKSMKESQPNWEKDPMLLGIVGAQAASDGNPGEARRILGRMESLRKTQYVDAFLAMPVCTALKDRQLTRMWLKRADEERSALFVYLPILKDVYHLDAELLAEVEKGK